ncbi:hypothetical protein ACB092_03G068500 [Castanea dentata]
MDYITFESRRSTVEELMEALVDANINMIGVWGMAGVGKSTLIREVAMKVKEKKLFDEVAIATVTHKPDSLRIQGEIADKLYLKLDKETLSGRADLLRERLTKDNNKKILVILDDIWEKLDLNEIGIPYDGCKIVVTSRNRDILSSEMGAQKDFGLEVLPKEEAWCLFEKLSGDSLKESNLRSKAMEKRMQEVIYSAIKLDYSHLESEELQSFFLFCAQNQVFSVISYQDLLKKCFGLRLFHGISTLEEARNRTYTLVRSLKDAGLLLDALDSSQCFHIHDLTHDVPLLISYETQNVLTMGDEVLVEWPDEDDMKLCTSIFVYKRDIHELPDRLECPELSCLYVHAKDRKGSFKISDTFFKGMRKLKVLYLTYLRLSSLPSSLILLTNLQTLCLDQCVLGDIAMIGEMKNLEILSLGMSEIKQLPREIGLLTHLRMLDLTNCKKLQEIPANVLSCLILLEELYVGNSFTQWEVEGLNNEKASLAELKHLSRLSTLQVAFPNLESLIISHMPNLKIIWHDKFAPSSFTKLQSMEVQFCESLMKIFQVNMLSTFQSLKSLVVEDCDLLEEIFELQGQEVMETRANKDPQGTFSFQNLQQIEAAGCESLKSLFPTSVARCLLQLEDLRIGEKGAKEDAKFVFPKLTLLILQKLSKLKWFYPGVHTSGWPLLKTLEVTFPSLETLTIMHMQNLKIIWHDQLAKDSFFKLQTLFVKYCENLVNIFKFNILTRFQSQERLQVCYCGSLQEVFELQRHDVRESHAVTTIPLKRLILRCLLKMKQSLKSLFPASVARFLMQLEDLLIGDCGVEEIVSREEIAKATAARFVFPKVTLLALRKLPKLKWFCRGVHTSEWPLLKELEVRGCDQIEIITSKILNCQETVGQSQLETSIQQPLFLVLRWGGNYKMKEIQHDQLFEECLYKLKVLHVIDYVAVSDWITFLKRLHNLEKLFVSSSSWEEIFPYKELFDMENHATILAQLRELKLSKLPIPIFHNLENIKVFLCGELKILVPSSISFQNLANLEIWKCHGLINLVTSSTVKSLLQLKKMSVSECERITEVVTGEGVEASEVIIFTQLTHLKLDCLPNLSSFCSRSYSFEFPYLEEVIVRECPEMKTFSHGALKTPKLERVQATQVQNSKDGDHPKYEAAGM